MDQTKDSNEETFIDKETIEKAINTLKVATNKFEEEKNASVLMPYIRAFIKKILENLSSAKMLIFFIPLWTSVFFLVWLFMMSDEFQAFIVKHPDAAGDLNQFFQIAMDGFISWCTFTVSLGGTVIVVRETFKVSKLKALNTGMPDTNPEIINMQE